MGRGQFKDFACLRKLGPLLMQLRESSDFTLPAAFVYFISHCCTFTRVEAVKPECVQG